MKSARANQKEFPYFPPSIIGKLCLLRVFRGFLITLALNACNVALYY